MTARLTWRHDFEGSTREVACLGAIEVGAILVDFEPGNEVPTGARWTCALPRSLYSFGNWKVVRTVEKAKAAVEAEVTAWLERAGLEQRP